MRSYHIITYGCQMNEHDSENIAGLLEAMGYEHVDDPYKADVTVINTCSVRENADKRFFGTLGQFKKVRKNNPDFVLAVCGCMPQQPRVVAEINKRFSWVDIVFGTQNIAQFPELLEERLRTGRRMRAVIANNPDISEAGKNAPAQGSCKYHLRMQQLLYVLHRSIYKGTRKEQNAKRCLRRDKEACSGRSYRSHASWSECRFLQGC